MLPALSTIPKSVSDGVKGVFIRNLCDCARCYSQPEGTIVL